MTEAVETPGLLARAGRLMVDQPLIPLAGLLVVIIALWLVTGSAVVTVGIGALMHIGALLLLRKKGGAA